MGQTAHELQKYLESAALQAAHFPTHCDLHTKPNTPGTWKTFREFVCHPNRSSGIRGLA